MCLWGVLKAPNNWNSQNSRNKWKLGGNHILQCACKKSVLLVEK